MNAMRAQVDDTVDVFNMPVRLGTFRSTVFPEFADYVDPAFKRIGRATFKRTASKSTRGALARPVILCCYLTLFFSLLICREWRF
jgi:hypothetical protein